MTTIRNDISRLWVIARIGRYYRALAVADSWLNGRHALEACLRLAAIFSDESNRLPLKAELCLAADWFNGQESPDTARHVPLASPSQQLASQSYQVGREWSPPAPILGAVRFPFLSTCLVSGTSTTAGKPAELKIPELGESVSTMQGLMHTFIDITDLDKVRYCFMLSEYHSATREPWSNRPWSAWQYLDTLLRVCGPDDFEEPEDYTQSTSQEARDLTDRLEKLALIDVAALSDVWPWLEIGPDHSSVPREPDLLQTSGGALGPSSLWDQAMSVLVRTVLSSSETERGLLDSLTQIPHGKASLRHHLVAVRDELHDAAGTPVLLKAAYAGEGVLDWSRFHLLAPSAIIDALNGPELQGAQKVCLCPDWSVVAPSDLARGICTFPNLRDVYIMELPGRASDGPMGELYSALIAHPQCPKGRLLMAGSLSCALRHQFWRPENSPLALQYPIHQLIVAHTPANDRLPKPAPECFHLGDGLLTPVRFFNGLVDLIGSRLVHQGGIFAPFLWGCMAGIFARAAPTLNDYSAQEINILPVEPFAITHWMGAGCFRTSAMRDLVPGTWTAVLSVRHLREQLGSQGRAHRHILQCSLIRPRNGTIKTDPTNATLLCPDDVEILGLEEWLVAVTPDLDIQSALLVDYRLQQLEKMGHTGSYPAVSFSRAPVDVQVVCEHLNRANTRSRDRIIR